MMNDELNRDELAVIDPEHTIIVDIRTGKTGGYTGILLALD